MATVQVISKNLEALAVRLQTLRDNVLASNAATPAQLEAFVTRIQSVQIQTLRNQIASGKADTTQLEAAHVKLEAIVNKLQAMQDQIVAGTAATPVQLGELIVNIRGVFTP